MPNKNSLPDPQSKLTQADADKGMTYKNSSVGKDGIRRLDPKGLNDIYFGSQINEDFDGHVFLWSPKGE